MRLTADQIAKILKEPEGIPEKQSCQLHDDRARFHTTPALQAPIPYVDTFITAFVAKILNKGKLEVFRHLLRPIYDTVEFCEGIFSELLKIFEANDRHLEFRFTNPALTQDFNTYLEQIGDDTFWQTKAFQKMKSSINSIVIVDLPSFIDPEIRDKFARPYYYFLDVQNVTWFQLGPRYKMEAIAFLGGGGQYQYIFDDAFYRVYTRGQGDQWVLVKEVAHDLGYCPARSFWTTPFEDKSKLQKRGPQTNSLAKLDWLLLLETCTKHAELYAGFPIDVMYETRCDYQDAQGNKCEDGYITTIVPGGIDGSNSVKKVDQCPNCKDKQILGPGTVLTAPARSTNDDPDLLAGMNRISADEKSLNYLIERITKYKAEISTNIIGFVSETVREAMNKEQIGSMLESQIAALTEVRDNFQNIHKFVLETVARLRYGSAAVVSITCNYGSKWFIHSIEKQQEQYTQGKTNGFANFELTAQFEQILLTKYKNNPTMLARARTLVNIEPYLNYTSADLTSLQSTFGLNKDLVRLKLDFSSYVQRFEREFTNLGVFMQFSPFEQKVAFVKEKLLQYVEEDYPEEQPEEPGAVDPNNPAQLPGNGAEDGSAGAASEAA